MVFATIVAADPYNAGKLDRFGRMMDKRVAPMKPSSRNLRKEFTGKSKEEIIGVVEGDRRHRQNLIAQPCADPIGADGYAPDVVRAVKEARELLSNLKRFR